jgi:hypothetical protein
MKKIALFCVLLITLISPISATAQWSWEGQIYFGLNQNLFIPVTFNGDVYVTVANGFTVRAPQAVVNTAYTMYKKGGGRFWFQSDNPLFTRNIVYVGKSDTVRLDGIFGPFVNDSIGYLYGGSIISSNDSISFFHLHQNDTVVQTFDASGYNHLNTNLYVYSDTRSALRIIKSSARLAGRVIIPNSGTLYIDGTYNAKVSVTGGKLITGENSVDGYRDYAVFANTFNDSTITVNNATMQIGTYAGPSLAYVKSGNVIQENGSALKIDVYNPNPPISWNLTPGIHSDWKSSFSDRIYMEGKDYIFKTNSKIDVNWDTAYISSIADDTAFYLPVIMLNNASAQQIGGVNDVTANQTLPGWRINFITGDGSNGTQTGWGYIKGKKIQLPDNVSDADCSIDPPATKWGIREVLPMNTTDTVHNFGSLTAGDIYGNDTVAIIGFMNNSTGDMENHDYPCHGIKIFYFDKTEQQIKLKTSFLFPSGEGSPVSTFSAMAIARYNNTGYIVVAGNDRHLYAYTPDGALKWRSNAPYSYHTDYFATIVSIADFNHDGIPEVYTGNRIFSLASGELLCDGGTDNTGILYHNGGDASIAADIVHYNDNNLELCAGTQIYRVNIPQGATTSSAGATMSLISDMELPTAQKPANASKDGATQVVDIDNDGELEVVVITRESDATDHPAVVYVWKPLPNNQSYLIGSYTTPINSDYYSIPMIGNIDNDIYPEIVYLGDEKHIYALDYVPANAQGNRIANKWTYTANGDVSSCTGMTLFDFNNDGKSEIVYRDETRLHIFEDDGSALKVEYIDEVYSYTLREFPLIVDIDDDGQAEIVVSGHTEGKRYNGYVRVFKSGGSRWAPARKVWNQYMYNAVNVNEDLTIPQYQLNPATPFPGEDGKFAPPSSYDDDNVRPYNNFRKQQTFLSQKGIPLWLAPRAVVDSTFYHYDAEKDSMSVSVDVINAGDVPFSAPFHITVYKDTVGNATKYTHAYSGQIKNGDTVRVTFAIRPYLSLWGNAPRLHIRVNDSGNSFSDQSVCDSARRDVSDGPILLAINDAYSTFVNNELVFDPELNDTIPPLPFTFNVELPKRGTRPSLPTDDPVRYSPPQDGAGIDTIYYTLSQQNGKFTSTAAIYIYIAQTPDNISDARCSADPPETVWSIKPDFTGSQADLSTYIIPVAGDLDGDSIPEILAAKFYKNDSNGSLYKNIYVYWGHDRDNPTEIITDEAEFCSYGPAIARIDSAGSRVIPMVVTLRHPDGIIQAYDAVTGAHVWDSDQPVFNMSASLGNAYSLQFVDFSSDGKIELLAGNRIFDAATGKLLLDLANINKGYAIQADPLSHQKYAPVAADLDGDGKPEYAAGNQVYSISITDNGGQTGGNTATLLASVPTQVFGSFNMFDGTTLVADVNGDGRLDVFASQGLSPTTVGFFAWDVQTKSVIAKGSTATSGYAHSMPFAGNVDTIPGIEILFTTANRIKGFRYNGTTAFDQVYEYTLTNDDSGATGITLFDFNQDGKNELVYRDENMLRILQAEPAVSPALGTFSTLCSTPGGSGTWYEYPIVADVDNDGGAEIVTVAGATKASQGSLRICKSGSVQPWAPARGVWNQYAYHVVNINEDLTVPQYPLNPATIFPGRDGAAGTSDDLQPYNNFLQQQTTLSQNGVPLWLMPNAVFDPAQTVVTRDGDSVSIGVCIVNKGDAALGAPVYATLYRDSVKQNNIIVTESINGNILPGDTACLTFGIPNIRPVLPFVQFVVRLNDKGEWDGGNDKYPYQMECDCSDSVQIKINPALDLMMRKSATLNGVTDTGRYSNPVAVLYSEDIMYEITVVNANLKIGHIIIHDTLPPYLKYVDNSVSAGSSGIAYTGPPISGTPPRDTIMWFLPSISSFDTITVTFKATPESGASASQPLYINDAWVRVSDTLLVKTNKTYHQGAGISLVTFSASAGGHIFNAGEQALDYRTTPRAGILIVPDSGRVFTGWSHNGYVSLRGEVIPADSGIMNYDSLVIYGNVELRANFAPLEDNPEEKEITEDRVIDTDDRVWSNGNSLYIRSKEGSRVRIYTPDGILRRQFVIAVDGVTALRLERGIYIVTLNGREYKIVVGQ